jgi:hypothetical protein
MYKNNRKIFFYVIFVAILLFFPLFISKIKVGDLDELWSYWFSYKIYNGSEPYKDFNMIIPPLAPWIGALSLKILGQNLISLRIIAYILYFFTVLLSISIIKTDLQKVVLILLQVSIIQTFQLGYFSYNTMIPFFVIALIVSEINNYDLLSGLIIGAIIITKHNIGIVILVASIIICFINKKPKKNIIIQFTCVTLPPILTLLICRNSLYKMYDYLIGGIKSFNNMYHFSLFKADQYTLTILGIIVFMAISNLIFLLRNRQDKLFIIMFIYTGCFSAFMFPMFDMAHDAYYLLIFAVPYFYTIKVRKIIDYIWVLILSYIIIIKSISMVSDMKNNAYDLDGFKYSGINNEEAVMIKSVANKIKTSKDKTIFVTDSFPIFSINANSNNEKYLINYGNVGKDGINRIINEFDNEKGTVFILTNLRSYQNINEITDSIMKYKKIDRLDHNKVYFLFYKN